MYFFWISMDLCGIVYLSVPLWISVDLCGSLWISVDLCGSLWISVDLCGSLWISVDLFGSWLPSRASGRPYFFHHYYQL